MLSELQNLKALYAKATARKVPQGTWWWWGCPLFDDWLGEWSRSQEVTVAEWSREAL